MDSAHKICLNDNQRNFLKELHALCLKYNIDSIYIEDGRFPTIQFQSNGQTVGFTEYFADTGRFYSVKTRMESVDVEEEK